MIIFQNHIYTKIFYSRFFQVFFKFGMLTVGNNVKSTDSFERNKQCCCHCCGLFWCDLPLCGYNLPVYPIQRILYWPGGRFGRPRCWPSLMDSCGCIFGHFVKLHEVRVVWNLGLCSYLVILITLCWKHATSARKNGHILT